MIWTWLVIFHLKLRCVVIYYCDLRSSNWSTLSHNSTCHPVFLSLALYHCLSGYPLWSIYNKWCTLVYAVCSSCHGHGWSLEFPVKYSLCFDHMVPLFSAAFHVRMWGLSWVLINCLSFKYLFFLERNRKNSQSFFLAYLTKIMKHHNMHIHVGVVHYDLYSPHYLTEPGNYSVKSEWVCKSLFVFCFLKVVATTI